MTASNIPIVFLHGWAQSQQVWYQQRAQFPDALFLNLPGHGGAADAPLDAWVDTIAGQLPEQPCLLVGWSLGGMLAMQIATALPERITALALISTTPQFKASDEWPHGSSDELFEGFRQAVSSGSPKALNRFFSLMLHGDAITRSDYNTIAKAAVDREHRVSQSGLKLGLALLEQLDLRSAATEITQPTLLMHGDSDAVIPIQAGHWLAKRCASQQQQFFNNCGHAPFLTQAAAFNQTLHTWWQQQ
ncbi:MAG: alpha/beta fold hydrolase [Mariprofundus sp.]|nr:alpha/beta fold hydrolase [Mariprofundus sp.]